MACEAIRNAMADAGLEAVGHRRHGRAIKSPDSNLGPRTLRGALGMRPLILSRYFRRRFEHRGSGSARDPGSSRLALRQNDRVLSLDARAIRAQDGRADSRRTHSRGQLPDGDKPVSTWDGVWTVGRHSASPCPRCAILYDTGCTDEAFAEICPKRIAINASLNPKAILSLGPITIEDPPSARDGIVKNRFDYWDCCTEDRRLCRDHRGPRASVHTILRHPPVFHHGRIRAAR